MALLSAMPLLRDTMIVLLFFFLIFAIGGVQLLSGYLKNRCFDINSGREYVSEDGDDYLCGGAQACPVVNDTFFDGTPIVYECGKGLVNPAFDNLSFDNMLYGLLVVFISVTMEGWSAYMVMYQKSFNIAIFPFFVFLVFIGAFFLLNLTLAVINSKFNETHKNQ